MRQTFYYKMEQFYYKVRQLLYNATILLQNGAVITKYYVYYKSRQYSEEYIWSGKYDLCYIKIGNETILV